MHESSSLFPEIMVQHQNNIINQKIATIVSKARNPNNVTAEWTHDIHLLMTTTGCLFVSFAANVSHQNIMNKQNLVQN